jgi:enamine deaminase RidA (YjgF/YER057c/UK114 family)
VRIVNPPELMAPRGFSHAVRAGQTLYLAGQTAHDHTGRLPGPGLTVQFDGALANLVTAVTAGGGKPDDVTWLQVFVTDMSAYRATTKDLAPIWRRHFGHHYPAMGLFGVTALVDPEAVVEIMGIAVIEQA